MRVRQQSATGDYTFGASLGNFLINSPAAVAQKVLTRLKLFQGEWFLDNTAGTPWLQSILGNNTTATADLAIKSVILGTVGVTSLLAYNSDINTAERTISVTATILTQYSQQPTTISTLLQIPPTA